MSNPLTRLAIWAVILAGCVAFWTWLALLAIDLLAG